MFSDTLSAQQHSGVYDIHVQMPKSVCFFSPWSGTSRMSRHSESSYISLPLATDRRKTFPDAQHRNAMQTCQCASVNLPRCCTSSSSLLLTRLSPLIHANTVRNTCLSTVLPRLQDRSWQLTGRHLCCPQWRRFTSPWLTHLWRKSMTEYFINKK